MNPNFLSLGYISIATLFNGLVLQYTNNVILFQSTLGAPASPLTLVTASNNNVLVKADYNLCFSTNSAIPLTAIILVDFPKQFDLKKSSYTCRLGATHSALLPYSAPKCTINNNLRRFSITGHTAAYTGGAAISLCYSFQDIENSRDTGFSFNFEMRVYDPEAKLVLTKTVGILDYPSNYEFIRTGYRIFIDNIPNIPLSTMSNDIIITLEKQVPYNIELVPTSPGFTFIPSKILFQFYQGLS
jgi:hypothetical protein